MRNRRSVECAKEYLESLQLLKQKEHKAKIKQTNTFAAAKAVLQKIFCNLISHLQRKMKNTKGERYELRGKEAFKLEYEGIVFEANILSGSFPFGTR